MHLARYLGRLQRSQRELADAYHAFRRRHPREVDLCTVCERLAAQCGDHAVRLEPFIRRYASGAPPDPLDRPAPDPTERSGTLGLLRDLDRKSTRLNSSHVKISYAVFCLKKKNICIV